MPTSSSRPIRNITYIRMLTRRMITRGIRRQNKARREFLREPRDGLIVFGNACNNVANARKFFVGLATMLQTPKSFSWDLQRCCKRQKVLRETCNSVANVERFFGAFAAFLQTPKSFSGHLQRSCKDQKVSRGICSIPANAEKFFEAFAALLQSISKSSALPLGLYQRHSSGIRILILSPNSRLECVSYRFSA